MAQDAIQIKEKIVAFLRNKGPSLPIPVGKEVELNTLFASAFLSELIHDKRVKTSNMKVGGSPLYLLPGQEHQLEKFSSFLKGKEKEAFLFLKEKKFLRDSQQEPAIRVALRAIRDFAIPFKRNEEVLWRYFTIPENELEEKTQQPLSVKKQEEKEGLKTELKIEPVQISISQTEEIKNQLENLQERLKPIIEEQKELLFEEKIIKKPKAKKKKDDKFLDKVKENLSKKNMEIIDVEKFGKDEIILKVKMNEKEYLAIAYNKKKINESDLVKAYKKATEFRLPYYLLFFGEPSRKTIEIINACKSLAKIEKME